MKSEFRPTGGQRKFVVLFAAAAQTHVLGATFLDAGSGRCAIGFFEDAHHVEIEIDRRALDDVGIGVDTQLVRVERKVGGYRRGGLPRFADRFLAVGSAEIAARGSANLSSCDAKRTVFA